MEFDKVDPRTGETIDNPLPAGGEELFDIFLVFITGIMMPMTDMFYESN